METFTFSSLHEYLDWALKNNPNASFEEVKNAKKEYWKQYYKYYRREKRKQRKEFVLGFYPKTMKQILQKKGDKTTSQYLYSTINKELQSETSASIDPEVFSNILQQLRELINLMEEFLDTEEYPDCLEDTLERFEKIEDTFLQLLNP